jgi:hypothetical protein
MFARLGGLKEFDSNFLFRILISHLRGEEGHQVPFEDSVEALHNLRLVNWLVDAWADELVDEEEIHAAGVSEVALQSEVAFLVVLSLLFVSCNLNRTTFSGRPRIAFQVPFEGLVTGCDYLVDTKFD